MAARYALLVLYIVIVHLLLSLLKKPIMLFAGVKVGDDR